MFRTRNRVGTMAVHEQPTRWTNKNNRPEIWAMETKGRNQQPFFKQKVHEQTKATHISVGHRWSFASISHRKSWSPASSVRKIGTIIVTGYPAKTKTDRLLSWGEYRKWRCTWCVQVPLNLFISAALVNLCRLSPLDVDDDRPTNTDDGALRFSRNRAK